MSESEAPAQQSAGRGWKSSGRAVAFWISAGLGVLVMTGAWSLFYLASLEEATEESKAVVAGTTMAGFAFGVGVIPLLFAHALGFVILGPIAMTGRQSTRSGLVYALAAIVIASAIGLGATAAMTGGQLVVTADAAHGVGQRPATTLTVSVLMRSRT
jgi:hypothetical protein